MSTPEAGSDFKAWIDAELADRAAFTALVVLVEIGERSVTPVVSTYVNVSAEIDWPEVATLFAGSAFHGMAHRSSRRPPRRVGRWTMLPRGPD